MRHTSDPRPILKQPSLVERIVSRYGVAAGLVSAALLLSFLLQPVFPDAFVFLFLAAVMASAWFGRAGPGLAAVFLSMAAVTYFFIPPLHSLRINRREVSYFVTFVLSAVVVSWFSSKRKHFEQTLKEKNIELEEKNIELEKALLAKDDFLASPATSRGSHCRQGTGVSMITTPADAAAKTGRAMELSSPVASLVPSLVLNAVVTFGSS